MMKLGWNVQLTDLLDQSELMNDYLEPFESDVRRANSEFDKFIIRWCVEQYVPLCQFAPSDIHLMYYEHLCTQPDIEIQRLFAFLDKPYSPTVLDQVVRPSKLSRSDSAVHTGANVIERWKLEITEEQIESAVALLQRFGLDGVYGSDPFPLAASGHYPVAAHPTLAR
jgi:hypothetical protein